MTPPDITHRWTWTGGRTLPDWLAHHHHWHADRPVIHTADGPRTLHTGWLVALWSDGVITVGSNTVADRVYGPDGLRGRLDRSEQRASEAEQRLKNIAAGLPRADAIQAEIGEMILQTHELRDQLRAAEARAAELERHLREADAENLELSRHNDRTCEAVPRRDAAEAAVARVRALADQWVQAGPPPLGTPLARWWDKRLVELNAVLNGEQPGPA